MCALILSENGSFLFKFYFFGLSELISKHSKLLFKLTFPFFLVGMGAAAADAPSKGRVRDSQ